MLIPRVQSFISFTVRCPALSPIPNGTITYAPDITPDFDTGTVAIHGCDPGFRLSGIETRLCLRSAMWSDQPPVCQRKIYMHTLWEIPLWRRKLHVRT